MRRRPRVGLYQRAGKRVLDVAVACVALPLAAPVMGVTALLVRIALGRDLWYRQERIGLNGRSFTIVKFRTMSPDRRSLSVDVGLERDRRVIHKTPDDPRHTKLGRALRGSGLDELPQLVNVLRGEMSVVGPRPELPLIVARYEQWQHARHEVRPGITGLWQVSGRGRVPMHESVAMDLEYVRNISLRGDLKILFRTLPALLRRTGA